MSEELELVRGTDNVFADLGLPNADSESIKSTLAAELIRVMREQNLTAVEVGRRAGVAAADISRIRNADLGRFSIDRLVRILNSLNQRVGVSVWSPHAQPELPHAPAP